MDGKTVLVTGASSGIGKATAAGLSALGARVVMVSRTQERGLRARAEILRTMPGASLEVVVADLSTTAAIRRLADVVAHKCPRLDVLVNNAAVLTSRRKLTSEGFEMQFFVNHLAYFLLTGLLLDVVRASAPARIVNVASTAHSRGVIDFDDLQLAEAYRGWQAYANTKLMNILFTYELARRLEGTRVTANVLHPGVIHTNLLSNFSSVMQLAWHAVGRWFKQPEDGAETPVYLASSPEVEGVSGKYFRHCKPMGTSAQSNDREIQRRLWKESERLSGFTYPI
ncbi:MAG TPA: SDR family oxidoreductase [Candidatus Krumholzibacteria bacterium]|nr:SDR family oxidoreductase [Candidatus Krumholzibacteria bacterium]